MKYELIIILLLVVTGCSTKTKKTVEATDTKSAIDPQPVEEDAVGRDTIVLEQETGRVADSMHGFITPDELPSWMAVVQDNYDFDVYPDSIGGKPVVSYLEDDNISQEARQLFLGGFEPQDNARTIKVLNEALSAGTEQLPFYDHLLSMIILYSEGALREYVQGMSWDYIESHADQVFELISGRPANIRHVLLNVFARGNDLQLMIEEMPGSASDMINQHKRAVSKKCDSCSAQAKSAMLEYFSLLDNMLDEE